MEQKIMNEEVKTQEEPKEENLVKGTVKKAVSKGKEFVKRNKWRVAAVGTAIGGTLVAGAIKLRRMRAEEEQEDEYDNDDVTIVELEPEYGYEEFADPIPTGEEVTTNENDTEGIAE